MKDPISIFFAADDKYARHCAVTITSIINNTASPDRLEFYILSSDISKENQSNLEKLCADCAAKISIVNVDLTLFASLPTILEHLNLNMYSRLLIPDLCPDRKKIVYLDCDILVLSDIAELFDLEMDNKPIAAIPHIQLPYQEVFVETFNVRDNDIYFNSGVLVIDTELWRQKQYGQTILEYCSNNIAQLHFADQDALNVVFWENYYHLPGTWNVETRLYKEKLMGVPQDKKTNGRIKSPKILHYTGPNKPWSSENYVPMRHLYARYSEQLSNDFEWLPFNPEPKRCSTPRLLKFIWTCIYFRTSCSFSNFFPPKSTQS
ncbi:glycosyltransferase family 8 protein [Chamaesiphon sp. OTE_8_metabat_110]|uniref:glycosyltransferase family 8 protein n=1 Tax=Chamaesiphon sp. OTE_8_metabat_110 TaxID=2964696 RepID=UPI00286ACE8F|nr:glycosyltransferase family 8 protein [Chamaesiphon sp. OTE_8_metabat_110]